jgi:hypothetical protein
MDFDITSLLANHIKKRRINNPIPILHIISMINHQLQILKVHLD